MRDEAWAPAGREAGAVASGALLQVRGLHVAYGRVDVLHGIDLTVADGQTVAVIGPNGAGKTSLLAAIMAALPVSGSARGALEFLDRPLTRKTVEQRVALGLTLVPEKRELFADMSVIDNLRLGAFRHHRAGPGKRGQSARALEDVFALFPKLEERRNQIAGTLSGGERQMLALGRAWMARPKLLMLDEPSLGLAPLIVREIFRAIVALKARGTAILLVEQNARAALQVADYAYVLETGELALEGPADRLANDPRVIDSYLGLGRSRPSLS